VWIETLAADMSTDASILKQMQDRTPIVLKALVLNRKILALLLEEKEKPLN